MNRQLPIVGEGDAQEALGGEAERFRLGVGGDLHRRGPGQVPAAHGKPAVGAPDCPLVQVQGSRRQALAEEEGVQHVLGDSEAGTPEAFEGGLGRPSTPLVADDAKGAPDTAEAPHALSRLVTGPASGEGRRRPVVASHWGVLDDPVRPNGGDEHHHG